MATDAVVHPFQPNYGVDKNRFSPDIKRFSMVDEYELDKDFNRSSKKNRSDQEDKSKENESEHLLNNLNQSTNGGLDGKMKKHRAARKRNRSDMSPEELRKLRERERKAQQSRRDRIRAQKRENQQWQDEDAAWEAFLDQTDCKKPSTKHNRSSMPSMVCSIDENQDTKKSKGKLEKQNSLESTTGSSHSTSYLSDDSSTHSSYKEAPKKNNKESEEEMTKIPEEEPLRRHREEKLPPPSKEKLSHHAEDEKPLHRNGEEKKEHCHHYHHHLPSPPSHPYHHMYHQKLSPHSFHPSDLYPKMFHHDSPIHHHPHPPPPYSPTEHKHFLAIQQHHHDKKHDPHHHDPHHHHYQPSHFMSTVRSPQNSPSSNHRENKKLNTSPQHEKKKVISRNVDRKKLSEEELEELRRRERDYQRERRARIRMEKAKTQAQQERFNACGRYPPPPPPPHAEMYRHHIHHHPQATDTIARYDHEHYRVSPGPKPTPKALEVEIPECEKVNKTTPKVETDLLQVVPKTRDCEDKHTPPTGTSSPVEEYPMTKAPKKSLLESICSTLKRESSEWDKEELGDLIIDLKRDDDKRQTTPKMEPVEERVDDVHYLTKIKDEYHSKEYDDSTLSQAEEQKLRDKLTEEQLERRRKSNREAQRRRRARLKMQGHLEERHEFETHDELVDKEDRIEYKHCKNRPDSLYMSPYEGFTGHRRSPYHKERNHHEGVHYIHEKYSSPQRVIMDTHYHHGNKHPAFYHSPHHRISEMDDSQRHRPHFYYDSPEFRHHLPHRYRDTQHRRHETVGEREREYTRSRSPHAHSRSRSTSKSATPPHSRKAPSPTPSDPQHHSHQHNSSSSRRESESKDDSISTSNEINDSTASKSSGRKRKQFAPRKLAATSVNTTPDEEVPVDESQPTAAENLLPATENGDHPFEEEENKVVILPNGNEEEDLEENS